MPRFDRVPDPFLRDHPSSVLALIPLPPRPPPRLRTLAEPEQRNGMRQPLTLQRDFRFVRGRGRRVVACGGGGGEEARVGERGRDGGRGEVRVRERVGRGVVRGEREAEVPFQLALVEGGVLLGRISVFFGDEPQAARG